MVWMISWTWRPDEPRHTPPQPSVMVLPDEAPVNLPWAIRTELLRRTLSEADRSAARFVDMRV